MSPSTLETNGQAFELPPATECFEGLLATKFLGSLPKEDRFRIKCIVEELGRESRLHRNDILDHYGINRFLYYTHIDTIQEKDLTPPPTTPQPELTLRKHSAIADLTAREQLALYEQVEDLRLRGILIPDACERVGIYEAQYFRLDRNQKSLRGRAAQESASLNGHANNGIVRERRHLDPGEFRLRVLDAVVIHSIAMRRKIADAARDLGITYADLHRWQETKNAEPVFPIQKGHKRRLVNTELHLSADKKVRLVRGLKYLEGQQGQSRYDIAQKLGYRDGVVEEWVRTVEALSAFAKTKKKQNSQIVSVADMESLSETTALDTRKLQPWLKSFRLKDAYTQVQRIGDDCTDPQQLLGWWERVWSGTCDTQAENELARYYHPVVTWHAKNMHEHLPDHISEDDLIADGSKGLLDAIRAFDLSRNTKFVTFSALRITGEMKDGLRKLDWVPRLVRSRVKKLENARGDYVRQHGREATEAELAVFLGMTPEQMHAMYAETNVKKRISIDVHGEWDEQDLEMSPPVVEANASEEATARLLDEDREEVQRELLAGMTENEKAVIVGYYFDRKTMKRIGEELDLSESRVSQMHSALLPRLKERILSHANENDTLGYLAAAFGPRGELELAS